MSSQKWVLFEHFCDELYKYHKEILDDKIFSSTPLTSFGITKTIYEDFEEFTINNKNFKGFPTAKGPRMCEKLPKKTKIPKSNEIIVKMLSNYFGCANKRKYIERVLNLELQRGPKITLEESNQSDDSDEDLDTNYSTIQIKQELSEEKKRKSIDAKESPLPKQRKMEDSVLNTNENPKNTHDSPVNTHDSPMSTHKSPSKTEESKSTNPKININKPAMVKFKREMKERIDYDENQKNKDMPKTKEVSKRVQALLESSKSVYANEMQEITLS